MNMNVRKVAGIICPLDKKAMNDRLRRMDMPTRVRECGICAICFLMKMHAVPTRRQPRCFNAKHHPLGRIGYARSSGAIVLLSSHDLDLSLQLADTVWLLDGRGALQVGTPDELIGGGHIGQAFDTRSVRFSAERGRFELIGDQAVDTQSELTG